MCGIAGIINFGPDEILPVAHRADFVSPLQFRGPDDQGDWHYQSERVEISLFHTRLSIIDQATGHQPMLTQDEAVVVVLNGEIYNYQILREELIRQGFRFRSTSDTEVLLHSYRCWGFKKLLEKIDGMFAFALFDKKENRLFLARDRFGKKPLYYCATGRWLMFSSDIRSFRVTQARSWSIDLHALGYFFAEYGTPGESTVWQEIKKIKPSGYLQFGNNGVEKYERYWNLQYTESCPLVNHEIVEKTDYLISQAVKKRLVSDVRVSALLSGGIDSTLVVAKMAQHSSERVKTYSVGFYEIDFNELPYARKVADRFQTDHTELIIEPQNLAGIDSLIVEYGEPFADSSMIPTYLMSKQISKSEKVVLGGDGGDEFFGGYDSYYFALKYETVRSWGWLHFLSELIKKWLPSYRTFFLERLLLQAHEPDYTLLNRNFSFDRTELKRLLDNETFYQSVNREHEAVWNEYASPDRSSLINVMSGSLRTRLLNDYLVKVDRASMYASLEMRSPYLDKDLAEFAATLKPGQIFRGSEPKAVLKQIARKYFPVDFVYRKKMGFGIPIGKWFRDSLTDRLKEVVLGGRQKMIHLNYNFIETLMQEHENGIADHTDELWSLYVFHIWAQHQ